MTTDPTGPEYPPLSSDVKNWGVLCHLSALLGFIPPTIVYGAVVGPLALWLIKGKDHPFVMENAKEALNFQLSMLIYEVFAGLLICVGIGVVLLPLLIVINAILIVVAALKASNGDVYRYFGNLRLIQ